MTRAGRRSAFSRMVYEAEVAATATLEGDVDQKWARKGQSRGDGISCVARVYLDGRDRISRHEAPVLAPRQPTTARGFLFRYPRPRERLVHQTAGNLATDGF